MFAPGPAAIVQAVKDNGVPGGVVLIVAVLVVAVLMRPFQIAMVQLLEGYWRERFALRAIEALAVERHIRKASVHRAWQHSGPLTPLDTQFKTVVAVSRLKRRRARKMFDAKEELATYPLDYESFLPTRLGNVLRRGESTAGERYGLNTVVTYPRLYSFLGPKLEAEIGNQLDLIDTSCTFAILFAFEAALSLPLVWRMDWWGVVPLFFAMFAALSYRGARRVAAQHAVLLNVAYDLHRFDMLRALRRKLPRTPEAELKENQELSQFLADGKWPRGTWIRSYDHPD
jgi:hypothetical protein